MSALDCFLFFAHATFFTAFGFVVYNITKSCMVKRGKAKIRQPLCNKPGLPVECFNGLKNFEKYSPKKKTKYIGHLLYTHVVEKERSFEKWHFVLSVPAMSL